MADHIHDAEVLRNYAFSIAAQTSGVRDAVPDEVDYEIAEKVFALVEKEIQDAD